MKNQILLIILCGIGYLHAFEVNTHQALTRCAITNDCNDNGGTKNLDDFVENTNLSGYKDYDQELFEKYKLNGKYVNYEDYMKQAEEAIKNYKVTTTGDYKGMIEAGSILEDAVHHNALFSGDGRFNNHFYAAQVNSKASCTKEALTVAGAAAVMGRPKDIVGGVVALGNPLFMKTNKALCLGFGARTDSIDWVLNKDVDLSMDMEFNNKEYGLTHRKNRYGLDDTFDYFHDSFKGSESERRKNQAKLFASLGFMVHLLQDIHSPAHCRDSSHPKGDYLEMYGREDGGYFLRNGSFSHGKNNPHITQAIKKMDMHKEMIEKNSFVSYEDFFKKEAEWVSKNFFAEAHIQNIIGVESSFSGGTRINNLTDIDSIFDDNPLPSTGTTYENEKDEIVSTGNTVNHIHGNLVSYDGLGEKPIALIDRGVFFDNEHIILPTYKMDYTKNELIPGRANTVALEMTSVNVMPRAVASTQAFINFFFRGQIKASLSEDHTQLVIKNKSNTTLVSDPKLLTFKSGGKFTLYVENSGTNQILGTYTLNKDIKVNGEQSINIGNVVANNNVSVGTKITVVFDGAIGDDMGGYDDYNIGMRGLSADVFEVVEKPEECTDSTLANTIKQVKSALENSSNCVKFPDIEFQKTIWIDDDNANCGGASIKYKNAALWGTGSRYDNQIEANKLISYFNQEIYKLPEPKNEVIEAEVYSFYEVDRYNNNDKFNVSFQIKTYKDGKFENNIDLIDLLSFEKFSGAVHVGREHYDIVCHGSSRICTYLKSRVSSDSTDQLEYFGLDWVAYSNAYQYFIGRVSQQLEYYYENSTSDEEYPKDWLKRIVDWIESYDCKKAYKINIFYDETRMQKTNALKGLE
ncbi:hypothetical protein KKC13_09925 [bacterium]|nr:hypothetical protein [bacterium]MBU1956952.1 hypothetical protein [bacterium]